MECKPSDLTKALVPLDSQKDTKYGPLPLKPCNVAFCAKKGQGKSTLLMNLLMKKESPWYKFFDLIFLISPTAKGDDKMLPLVEDIGDQYYEDLTIDHLNEIIERTEEHTAEWKKKKKKGQPHYCLILDDCIHALKTKNGALVSRLASQNRHLRLTNLILVQKWNSYMPTLLRSNLDCVAFWHTENKAELDSFIKEIGSDEDKLMALYEYATAEPYSFLWINMYSQPVRYYKKFDQISCRSKT